VGPLKVARLLGSDGAGLRDGPTSGCGWTDVRPRGVAARPRNASRGEARGGKPSREPPTPDVAAGPCARRDRVVRSLTARAVMTSRLDVVGRPVVPKKRAPLARSRCLPFVSTPYILPTMQVARAKLFQNGGSQAVRLPRECRFPEGQREVTVRREGARVILEPVDVWPDDFRECLGGWAEGIARPRQAPLSKLRDPFA
jgi:antitoxin VapB